MKISSKILLSILFLFLIESTRGQNQDFSLTLKESVLNKMFKAIGEIHGTSVYSFMFIDGTYDWTLINPQIKLHPNKADFICDVRVTIGNYSYLIHVSGNVEICYEPTTNLIYVEITEAKFPLNMMFFGKLHHLKDINLTQYFETPLTFEGPLTIGTEILFNMPDNTQKKIFMHPLNCGVKIAEKEILVTAEMEFVNKEKKQTFVK
jgi:hypothetical protein